MDARVCLISLMVAASGAAPTPPEVVTEMLKLAKVDDRDVIYDLGSGDGRVLVTAAQRLGARGVGVDRDPERITEARAIARTAGVKDRVTFRQGDLFQMDLSRATVLTLFLSPDVNVKVRSMILRQLTPGARVVSHDFDMGDWKADTTLPLAGHTVYLWIVPALVHGQWQWEQSSPRGPQQYTMDLSQHYQRVSGAVTYDKGTLPLADTKLSGRNVAFTVAEKIGSRRMTMRYTGEVVGSSIIGTVALDDGVNFSSMPWSAKKL
jgi:SAM-dependent methyltransferase